MWMTEQKLSQSECDTTVLGGISAKEHHSCTNNTLQKTLYVPWPIETTVLILVFEVLSYGSEIFNIMLGLTDIKVKRFKL